MPHFDLVGLIKTAGHLDVLGQIFAETGPLVGFVLPGDSLLFAAGGPARLLPLLRTCSRRSWPALVPCTRCTSWVSISSVPESGPWASRSGAIPWAG